MKSIGWCILYTVFVHANIYTFDVAVQPAANANSVYKFIQPVRRGTDIFADYVFARSGPGGDNDLLIFKMDRPNSGPSLLTGAVLGGLLGLMFAEYKYHVAGNFPNKVKRCVLIGGVLGAATCALINAYLPKHKPLKVFVIDANLTADKRYYAVQYEYRDERPYGPNVIVEFAVRWIKSAKDGIPNFADNELVMKKYAMGNYYGDIKKDRKVLLRILASVM